MSQASEQLRWILTANAQPGEPGEAYVSVLARNAMVPELAAECERAAQARFSEG